MDTKEQLDDQGNIKFIAYINDSEKKMSFVSLYTLYLKLFILKNDSSGGVDQSF